MQRTPAAPPPVMPVQRLEVPALPQLRGRQPGAPSRRCQAKAFRVFTDASAAILAAVLAYLVHVPATSELEQRYVLAVALSPVLLCLATAFLGGYGRSGALALELRLVVRAAACVGAAVALLAYALVVDLPPEHLLLSCSAYTVLAGTARGIRVHAGRTARRRRPEVHHLVVVGDESLVVDLVGRLTRQDAGRRVVGACVPGARSAAVAALGVPVLGDLDAVPAVVGRFDVDTVVVTSCAQMPGPVLRRLAWQLEGLGVELVLAPGLIEVAIPRIRVSPLGDVPMLQVVDPELAGGRRLVKASLDRLGAALALVALAPVLLGIAIAVRSTTQGPVLFSQTRVGRGGREFRMWKFRSMHLDAEQRLADLHPLNEHGSEVLFKMRSDPRVTHVGRWLRRLSLDELPQLVNVCRGEMSLVGPRPPLPREVERYGRDVHRRLLVRPGLTGLWQISGRSELSWDESIRLDLHYVENWSLSLDAMILWKTLSAVLGGRGAY